jgi:error-prone DNA polymerase
MVNDYAILGLSPRYHPLGLLRARLPRAFRSTADIPRSPDGSRIQVAGLVVCRQRPETAKGITFILLEDEHGLLNVIVHPDLYQERRHIVRGEPFVVVEGLLRHDANTTNLVAERIWPLSEARSAFAIPETLNQSGHEAERQPPAAANTLDEMRQIAPPSHNYR